MLDNVVGSELTEVNISVSEATTGRRTAGPTLAVEEGVVEHPLAGHLVGQPHLEADGLTGANISGNIFSNKSLSQPTRSNLFQSLRARLSPLFLLKK